MLNRIQFAFRCLSAVSGMGGSHEKACTCFGGNSRAGRPLQAMLKPGATVMGWGHRGWGGVGAALPQSALWRVA